MNVAALLPRLGPPHDPLSLLLTRFDRWRGLGAPWCSGLADDDAVAISLARLGPAGPDELAPFGTLGGAVLPAWAALAPDDGLYMLDRRGKRLLSFDRCACAFVPLPCTARSGPLAMTAMVAIAADRTMLAVAGSADGRGRVVVLQRATLSIVTVVDGDFEPTAVAFTRGCIAVADGTSGAVLLFDLDARPVRRIDAVGLVATLTGLEDGRLLAVTAQDVRLIAGGVGRTVVASEAKQPGRRTGGPWIASSAPAPRDDGSPPSSDGQAQVVTPAFARDLAPALPLVVDGAANLDVGAFCGRPKGKAALFGPDGAPLPGPAVPQLAPVFALRGRHVTEPLDSAREACQWHRIRFRADIPAKCRLTWRTRSAALDFPPEMVADESEPGWSSSQSFAGPLQGEFEFLVGAGEGRWLWLEAVLEGDGAATPRLCGIVADYPRISLARYLPAAMVADPSSADLTHRFLSIFDTGFRAVERRIDEAPRLYDPRTTPAAMLDWLGGWLGLGFSTADRARDKRRLIRLLPRLFRKRGTLDGLEETLAVLMGFDDLECAPVHQPCGPRCGSPPPTRCRPRLVLEHWRLRRWLFLGRGRLGESSRLWGESILNRTRLGGAQPLGSTRLALERDPIRDPFHAHAHRLSIFLPAARASSASARGRIEATVRRDAPAQAAIDVHWVEPNMRLGIQSTLGFDTVLGMRAPGRFGEAPLGDASALAAPQPPAAGLRLGSAIGRTSRLGPRGASAT